MTSQNKDAGIDGTEQKTTLLVIENFRDSFGDNDFVLNPHKSKIGKWIFNSIANITLLLLILILVVTALLINQANNADYTSWLIYNIGAVAVPIFLSTFICILVFRHLIGKFPNTLLRLAKSGRFKVPQDSPCNAEKELVLSNKSQQEKTNNWTNLKKRLGVYPKSWESFPDDFIKAVSSPWGSIIFFFWLIFGGILAYFFAYELGAFETRNALKGLLFLLNLGIAPIFLAYLVAYIMWILFVIAGYIRWLMPTFQIDIQPEHADQCGGVKRLGDICFEIGLILVIPSILVGFFVFLTFNPNTISPFKFGVYTALFVLVVFASVAFFWPLLKIHNEMVKEKERFNDEAISKIAPVKNRLRDLVSSGEKTDIEKIKDLEKQLEALEKLYPENMNYPTWPFTTNVVLVFYTSQILPIFTVVKGIVEFVRLVRNDGG